MRCQSGPHSELAACARGRLMVELEGFPRYCLAIAYTFLAAPGLYLPVLHPAAPGRPHFSRDEPSRRVCDRPHSAGLLPRCDIGFLTSRKELTAVFALLGRQKKLHPSLAHPVGPCRRPGQQCGHICGEWRCGAVGAHDGGLHRGGLSHDPHPDLAAGWRLHSSGRPGEPVQGGDSLVAGSWAHLSIAT